MPNASMAGETDNQSMLVDSLLGCRRQVIGLRGCKLGGRTPGRFHEIRTIHPQYALQLLGILGPFSRITFEQDRRQHFEIDIREQGELIETRNVVFVFRIPGELCRGGRERGRK